MLDTLARITKCKDKLDKDVKDEISIKKKADAIELKELSRVMIRGIVTSL